MTWETNGSEKNEMMTTNSIKQLLGMAAAIGVCISIGGCASLGKPTGAGFASVEIEGHTQKEIEAATIAVFERAGYLSSREEGELVFESEGKEWMQLAYKSNLSGGAPVMERVRAQIVNQNDGVFRLQCSAYILQPLAGTSKKEIKLRRPRSGPYRELLEQVVQKLSETP
jgi:hypothetical protein